MADLAYSLTLDGKKITNGSKTSFTIGSGTNGIQYDVSLYGLSFDRRIYQPGHIQAEILMTSSTEIKDVDAPNVDDLTACLLDKSVSLSVDGSEIAKGYYVHEIFPQIEKTYVRQETVHIMVAPITLKYYKFDIYVKLDIFSPDKKMMLNRFSRAYLGQRLIDDIVENGKDAFKCSLSVVSGVLNNLSYEEEVKGQTMHVELIHPYLVQYNESFYDFITRVANRCGEVFFFENGKLHFGISDKSAVGITDATRIVFQRISGNPLSIADYARDSVKGKWKREDDTLKETIELGEKDLITDPIDNPNDSEKKFPMDVFLQNADSDYTHFYNSEVASEDQYMLLYKGKFANDRWWNIFWGDTTERFMVMTSEVLNSTSLLELLSTAAVKIIQGSIRAGFQAGEKNKKGNEILKDAALDRKNEYAVLLSKVDNLSDHWVTLNYYHDIRCHSEEQMRRMVCVDMGSGFMNVHLGDKVTLPNDKGTTYVVVGVEMSSAVAWKRSYETYSGEPAAKGGVQSQRFYAIPMAGSKFYPPLLPGKPFRQCGPQPAFVVDSGDPTSQGRVRVRYPWQQSTKAEKDDVDDKDKEKKTAEGEFGDSKETFEKYVEFFVTPDYSDIVGNKDLSEEEKEEAKKKRLKQCEEDTDPYDWEYKVKESTDQESQAYKDAEKDYKDKAETYRKAMNAWRAAKEKLLLAEAATPWIRMSTPMATAEGGGMFFRPEVGDEVMVDYENGNIERPYVVGTLYSKNVRVPDAGSRVIVSRNGHTIKMDDPSDSSEFVAGCIPGLKLLKSYGVKLDFGELEGDARKILGGIELTDKYGFYNIKMSSHNRSVSISSPFGDVDINAFTGISINAPNGDIQITGKNVEISAYNKLSINSGKNVGAGWDEYRMGYFRSLFDLKELGKAAGKVVANLSYGKLFALPLLRSLLEVFIRPVDGTLQIQSNRYLKLEAGQGKAAGEIADYTVHSHDHWTGRYKESKALAELMPYIKGKLDAYVEEYVGSYNAVFKARKSFVDGNITFGAGGKITSPATLDDMLKNMTAQQNGSLDLQVGGGVSDTDKGHIKEWGDGLFTGIKMLKKTVADYGELFASDKVDQRFRGFGCWDGPQGTAIKTNVLELAAVNPAQPVAGQANPLELFASISLVKNLVDNQQLDASLFTAELDSNGYDDWKKYAARRIAYHVIESLRATPAAMKTFKIPQADYSPVRTINVNGVVVMRNTRFANQHAPFTDDDWSKYVAGIRLAPQADTRSAFRKGFEDASLGALGKLLPWEFSEWKAGSEGRILFSDEENKTYRFKNGATERYDNFENRVLSSDEALLKKSLN